MIRVSVLYANEPGKKFDHDYYKNRHMRLVSERLKDAGLVRYEVDKGIAGGAPGAPAPFISAGGFRFAFSSFEELCALVGDLSDEEKAAMEVEPYTEEMYYDDLMRVTEECADPDIAMLLVRQSQPTVRWMKERGIRWIPMFGRQAYKVGNRFRFWGGLVLEAVGGGPGLIDMEFQSAAKAGVTVRFQAKAMRLAVDDRGAVTGVVV